MHTGGKFWNQIGRLGHISGQTKGYWELNYIFDFFLFTFNQCDNWYVIPLKNMAVWGHQTDNGKDVLSYIVGHSENFCWISFYSSSWSTRNMNGEYLIIFASFQTPLPRTNLNIYVVFILLVILIHLLFSLLRLS